MVPLIGLENGPSSDPNPPKSLGESFNLRDTEDLPEVEGVAQGLRGIATYAIVLVRFGVDWPATVLEVIGTDDMDVRELEGVEARDAPDVRWGV